MSVSIAIQIPAPCHENWNEMSPETQGRFCNSCQKTVIDFTQCSDEEILAKMQTEKGLCGRFNAKQLNRQLTSRASIAHTAMATAVLSIMTLSANGVQAQESNQERIHKIVGEPVAVQQIRIKGQVKLTDGITKKVKITRQNNKVVYTDEKGRFDLQFYPGEKIVFSHPEYEKGIVIIPDQENLNFEITLMYSRMILGKFIQTQPKNE